MCFPRRRRAAKLAVSRSTPLDPPDDPDPPNRPYQLHQRGSNETTYWPTEWEEKKRERLRGGKEDHVDGEDEEDEEDDEAEEEQVPQKKRLKWRFWARKTKLGAEKKRSEKEKNEKEKAGEAGEQEGEQATRKRRLRWRLRDRKKKQDGLEKKGTEKKKDGDDERQEATTKKVRQLIRPHWETLSEASYRRNATLRLVANGRTFLGAAQLRTKGSSALRGAS